jgi:hypothetical protein
MIRAHAAGLGPALAWLVFPLVPALLGRTYFEAFDNATFHTNDPRQWTWMIWVIMVGPLLGYGFLAGVMLGLADDRDRRGPRSWLARRALWVGVGPWAGFLVLAASIFLGRWMVEFVGWMWPATREWESPLPPDWGRTWWGGIAWWAGWIGGLGTLAYGWLFVAIAGLRRARRMGRFRQSLERGLVAALAFVGSLFGSFWAITAAWRSYFFDPRMVPLLMATLGLAVMGGCAPTMTYGEMRRGELFKALLMAWLLGLALAWRWWSRPRHKT